MIRPPLAVWCTRRPETSRWISPFDGIGSGSAAAAPDASRDFVPRRHDRVDLALAAIVLANADILRASRGRRDRRSDEPLDTREKVSGTPEGHLVGRPIEQSGKEGLLGPY
jgi:hypothetical protein